MADAPPTRLYIDPPMDQWQLTPRNGRSKPVIATGHQPTLWHPGILAKYLAADRYASHVGGTTLNISVEHNPIDTLSLDIPIQRAEVLSVRSLKMAAAGIDPTQPPNTLMPIDSEQIVHQIEAWAASVADDLPAGIVQGLNRLVQAIALVGSDPSNHAQQMVEVLDALMRPYLNQPMQTMPTRFLVTPGFVQRLLLDPVDCVRCYNRAAIAYPEAGIRRLYAGRDVVEVPLWAQGAGGRVPVYADLGDSSRPQLFTQDQAIDLSQGNMLLMLRPRALTLSAIMRSEHCDLFIHGTGGGVYDQVTERWWQDWTGEDLAPKAVVSADVYLPFDVSAATPSEHAQAQWFAHHLPHNVDRYTEPTDEPEASLRQEKRDLLDRMNDDRDQRRRAKAFKRIHLINHALAKRHDDIVAYARQRVRETRIGLSNRAISRRRDWCFALYPPTQLQALAQQIHERLAALPG